MRSITQVIETALRRLREEDKRTGEQPAWYPSVVSYGCDRKAVLSRAGVEGNPFSARTLRKFWMGSEIHKALQALVEQELKGSEEIRFLGHEISVRDQTYHIAGRLDTLVMVENELEVWEYKSAASGSFSYGDFPRKDHVLQVGIYLTFPPTPEPPELFPWETPKRGRLIYFSKDDARVQEYIIQATPELQAQVKDTLKRLEGRFNIYKENGTLPDVLPMVEKKGKMVFDWRCAAGEGCEYFGNRCVPGRDWDAT